ncbi:MAG: hypothetical protein J0M11_11565 [Anaerolineae bacterium]|nr:hypothetical protein [Anaerolineae bacterium]
MTNHLRYFQYISENKVNILFSQLNNDSGLLNINPKIEIAGISLGINYSNKTETDLNSQLIDKTIKLITKLEKKKILKPIAEIENFENGYYFTDTSNWQNGLFSLRDKSYEEISVTYTLWKKHQDFIVLLIGSPLNVLDNKKVETGSIHYSGTTKSINQLIGSHDFIDAARDLHLRETSNTKYKTGYIPAHSKKHSQKYFEESTSEPLLISENSSNYPFNFDVNVNSWDSSLKLDKYVKELDDKRGTLLAAFCIKTLSQLQLSKIELAFKIFNSFSVSNNYLSDINKIYIGSPIYTVVK